MKDLFSKLSTTMQSLIRQEEGQDLIEYGLIVGLISVGATAALGTIGSNVSSFFNVIAAGLSTAFGL